jgi:hypothetical protein
MRHCRPRIPDLRARMTRRGQSVVEFALILPVLLVLTIVIADFGRLFGAMIATESAAREAADYGAFLGSPAWAASSAPWTSNGSEMRMRACAALADQAGFSNGSGDCTNNPTVDWTLAGWNASARPAECGDRIGLVEPCVVHVRVSFDFQPIIPLPRLIALLGGRGGDGGSDPGVVTIVRESWFAVSDLSGS